MDPPPPLRIGRIVLRVCVCVVLRFGPNVRWMSGGWWTWGCSIVDGPLGSWIVHIHVFARTVVCRLVFFSLCVFKIVCWEIEYKYQT